MTAFQMLAQGQHGYPQPEDDYCSMIYQDYSLQCGIHGRQVAPFRSKRTQRASHSSFLQLNWVLDVFFVHPDVAADLTAAGISGISFGPTLDHLTGCESNDRVQLLTSVIISCAETSRLPSVTCRPENEESGFDKFSAGRKRYSPATSYCGSVKHHHPTSLAINSTALDDAPDLFQTAEWFGSGGSADRLTLCSERFVELVRQRNWRGLQFRQVQESGWSERATGLPRTRTRNE